MMGKQVHVRWTRRRRLAYLKEGDFLMRGLLFTRIKDYVHLFLHEKFLNQQKFRLSLFPSLVPFIYSPLYYYAFTIAYYTLLYYHLSVQYVKQIEFSKFLARDEMTHLLFLAPCSILIHKNFACTTTSAFMMHAFAVISF